MERMIGPLRQTAIALVGALALAGTAFAGGADNDDLGFGNAAVLDESELAQSSGGAEINIGDVGVNVANNSATLSGNSVDGTVTTGKITDNALNDVSGINSLMYNTGNNVNFQSNMQINVFLK